MSNLAIRVEQVSKQYRLGAIGGSTLRQELQSHWARLRCREDPNLKIGQQSQARNELFMALEDISFEVEKGDTLGIIGHNGAGKSTLLKLLSRVTAPSSGRIGINGRIASMLEVGTGFHPELSGRENVYMNGAILGMSRHEINRKFDDIVEFAEMSKFIDTPVKRYSSGMYVKLAFAVAAHLDSEILVMDEVLAVGDMKFQDKCLGKMGDVSSQEGRTVLYVSHNMSTISRLCRRCLVLEQGHKVFDGDTDAAIDLYVNNDSQIQLKRVFTRADYWDYYVRSIQMLSCEMLNTKDGVYNSGEELVAELLCHADRDYSDVRLRAEYFNGRGNNLGIACSAPLPAFKKGETRSLRFKLDTKMLSAGTYRVYLALYTANEQGLSNTIDLAKNAIHFQKNETPDSELIVGDYRLGGFARLTNLEILS
jgi:lipopolysaccharide transport system ATP-binding protein